MAALLGLHGVAVLGGLLAKKCKQPAGAMIGAVLAVVIFNVAWGGVVYPVPLRIIVQVCSGAVIGSRFARRDLRELRLILKPAALLVVSMLGFNLLFALLMTWFTPIDWMTALFSCAPGGVSDLALVAVEFGANTEQVTLLQLVRFVFVVSFFPPFMKRTYLCGVAKPAQTITADTLVQTISPAHQPMWIVFSLGAAAAGGILFRVLGTPAGTIVGAIIFTVIANIATEKICIPAKMKTIIQIIAGCYVGSQVTREALRSIGTLFVPMLLILAGVFAMSFGTAYVIHRLTGMEMSTCLFSSIPGGIAEMGLIAEEMELDTPKIIVMHTCRVLAVVCVMPLLVKLL